MVAEGLWGESKGQRERHDQRRPGETTLEQPGLAWTGEQQQLCKLERHVELCRKQQCGEPCCAQRTWELRSEQHRQEQCCTQWNLKQFNEQQYGEQRCTQRTLEQCCTRRSLEQFNKPQCR